MPGNAYDDVTLPGDNNEALQIIANAKIAAAKTSESAQTVMSNMSVAIMADYNASSASANRKTIGYHFGAKSPLVENYVADPTYAKTYASMKKVVSELNIEMFRPINFDSLQEGIRSTRAGAVDLMCTKPSVKYFAEKLEKLGLEDSDFSSTVDYAKDAFASWMVDTKRGKEWHKTSTFVEKVDGKYRANDTFLKHFMAMWMTHAIIRSARRHELDAKLAAEFDDL
jgi:hypothetical protein